MESSGDSGWQPPGSPRDVARKQVILESLAGKTSARLEASKEVVLDSVFSLFGEKTLHESSSGRSKSSVRPPSRRHSRLARSESGCTHIIKALEYQARKMIVFKGAHDRFIRKLGAPALIF